jgi:hypothetical protein
MDRHKIIIVAGAGGVGVIGLLYLRSRAAASAAAANSAGTSTSGNIDLGSLSSLAPASTGVSTGGMYAVDASGGSAPAAPDPTLDSSSSVASFASLLQGILTSGSQATAAAQSNAAANNAQATNAINAIAPTPAPAPAPSQSVITDRNLVERVGNYLVANTGLYATDTTYRVAWDNVAQANQQVAGSGWNYVSDSSAAGNMANLAAELSDSINPNWRAPQAGH